MLRLGTTNLLNNVKSPTGTRFSSTMAQNYVKRLTFFKIAKEEDIDTVLKEYEVLRRNAVKVVHLATLEGFLALM
jgi:hypothetical protein